VAVCMPTARKEAICTDLAAPSRQTKWGGHREGPLASDIGSFSHGRAAQALGAASEVRYIVNFNNGTTILSLMASVSSSRRHIWSRWLLLSTHRLKEGMLPDSRSQVLSRTTNFAARTNSSGNVVCKCHANAHQKNGALRALLSLKRANISAFCLYDRAAGPLRALHVVCGWWYVAGSMWYMCMWCVWQPVAVAVARARRRRCNPQCIASRCEVRFAGRRSQVAGGGWRVASGMGRSSRKQIADLAI
jgi:hypothetical protein